MILLIRIQNKTEAKPRQKIRSNGNKTTASIAIG